VEKTPISIRIDQDVYRVLARIAKEQDRTLSYLAAKLLRAAVMKEKKEAAA
jgi:predicted transcriptional regulator